MRRMRMMNILKSPIFCQFGALDDDFKFGRTDLVDYKGDIGHFASSPCGLSICSSPKLENEKGILGTPSYESKASHKSIVYERSSSLLSSTSTQGMLRCTWRAGFPHFVFSIDDQREVFVANILKNESSKNKSFDYLYSFNSRQEHGSRGNESDLLGKMRVRTSFTLCPRNSEVVETEFVLFGFEENFVGEKKLSSHVLRKNKGLSNKVVEVFKTKRSPSKFVRTGDFLENFSRDPCEDLCDNLDTNFELGAIVVKDHIYNNPQEIGGWGLKFLKKVRTRQTNESIEATIGSECCVRKNGGCSSSINVLVPVGFHGGPRSRNGGPSSVVQRWRAGGGCDCGGWDIGCPLRVLNTRPSKKEDVDSTNMEGECKSCDLFIQGSEQGVPIMELVELHDGLYSIHFQSTLSALQSFSIAVAIIHTWSPSLRPKLYRS